MKLKRRGLLGGVNRFRLILTLGLAVVLPAAALIYLNFSQLRAFQRDKTLEAAFHRDFQETLAITEKKLNMKVYSTTEAVRQSFPSPDLDSDQIAAQLDQILEKNPELDHAFLFGDKDAVVRTQPRLRDDADLCVEQDHMEEGYHTWFPGEAKMMMESMNKKPQPIIFYTNTLKRAGGKVLVADAYFLLPQMSSDRVVMGGVRFDPAYLKDTLFPGVIQEMVKQKATDQSRNQLAMIVYPASMEKWDEVKPLAVSGRLGKGSRK